MAGCPRPASHDTNPLPTPVHPRCIIVSSALPPAPKRGATNEARIHQICGNTDSYGPDRNMRQCGTFQIQILFSQIRTVPQLSYKGEAGSATLSYKPSAATPRCQTSASYEKVRPQWSQPAHNPIPPDSHRKATTMTQAGPDQPPAADIPRAYNPTDVEPRIYRFWEEGGYFTPKIDPDKEPFVVIMPRPTSPANSTWATPSPQPPKTC